MSAPCSRLHAVHHHFRPKRQALDFAFRQPNVAREGDHHPRDLVRDHSQNLPNLLQRVSVCLSRGQTFRRRNFADGVVSGTQALADRALKDPGEDAAKFVQRGVFRGWVMTTDLVEHPFCLRTASAGASSSTCTW